MASPVILTLPTILQNMIDFVIANSELTDVNIGSVIRTILEAAAINDAEQYVQILRAQNAFDLQDAEGTDLDRRAADFGLTRLNPAQAQVSIIVSDTSVTVGHYATLFAGYPPGTTVIQVNEDISGFPASGTLILDRDVVGLEEYVVYTSKSNLLKQFTLQAPGTVLTHALDATVTLSQQGADRLIPAGTVVFVPATAISPQINFDTTADAFVEDGDPASQPILAIAELVGSAGNVGSGAIDSFVSLPFPTATVTNPSAATQGRDRELDSDFVARIKTTIQSLSRATEVAIEAAAIGVTDGTDVVTTAKAVDNISTPGLVTLYIDDSTGLTPTTASVADEVSIADGIVGQTRGRLAFFPGVTGTLRLYVDQFRSTTTAVGVGTITDTTQAWTVNQWANFVVVDAAGSFFTITSNTANVLTLATTRTPSAGKYSIIAKRTDAPLVAGVDYIINLTVDEYQLTVPLVADQKVVAMAGTNTVTTPGYSYFNGLIRAVQRTISGDVSDLTDFPGVAAAGIQVTVTVPSILNQSFDIVVTPVAGVSISSLVTAVQTAVLNYVNKLNIGDDIIVSEVIFVIMSIPGVFDVQVATPATNVVIADNQIARTNLGIILVS